MNKAMKSAVDEVFSDYREDDGHDNLYQCYMIAVRLFAVLNPQIDSELYNDIPEFVALNKSIFDISQMKGN